MRFKVCLSSDVFGRTGRIFSFVAASVLGVALTAAIGIAGDLSPQPADGLSVANSSTRLLPQTQAPEESWLAGLHVSGYASETVGMWENPTALREYTHSRNNLATARSLLQVDENYRLNESNTFFAREWFVYEPPYSFNSANNKFYADPAHASFGHFLNGYHNQYNVRDAWWENKWGPLTTFVGNQIVVWGQSIAFRIGDVINPSDTCWNFGFANLEQSRNAQWMLHPILNLPEIGPLQSNFLEVVVQPGFSPEWWPEQTGDPYAKYRDDVTAGRALPCLPSASHGPSGRFDVQYSSQRVFGFQAPLIVPGAGGPDFNGNDAFGFSLVNQPASREFMLCTQLAPLVRKGFNYMPKGLIKPCKLGLNKHNDKISPIGDGTLVDAGLWHVPGMQPENWNEGARLHTLVGATEITALYYNDNTNGGAPWTLRWTPYTNLWNYTLFDIQEVGITADRPLPIPAALGEYLPIVGRAEAVYVNHESFESNKPFDLTGQRYSDVVKWMAALDMDQAYAPWLTSTGNLTAFFEVTDQIVLDDCKLCGLGNDLSHVQLKHDVSALASIGTGWFWEDIEPTWTMIFNPKGRTFAFFPTLVLNPPWTKKYFLKLQTIDVLGGDKENNIGLFKGQNLATVQFQYNFNLL